MRLLAQIIMLLAFSLQTVWLAVMFNPSTFGTSSTGFGGFGLSTSTPASANPMKDFEVSKIC